MYRNNYISIKNIINIYNSVGYLFKALVDNDNAAKSVIRRYKTNNVSEEENKKLMRSLDLKDGDTIEAPYQILKKDKNQNITAYYHIYFFDSEYADIGFCTNDIFEDDIPILSICVDKVNFSLDTKDPLDIYKTYENLFNNLLEGLNLVYTYQQDAHIVITLSFLKEALPESTYNIIKSYLENISESKTFESGSEINYYEYKYDRLLKYAEEVVKLSNNMYIQEGNSDKLRDILNSCI